MKLDLLHRNLFKQRFGVRLGAFRSTGGGGGPETFNSIGIAGDSLGDNISSALNYSRWSQYHADINYDNRNYAGGGMRFNVGGTTSAQMLSTQLPQIQLRTPDILFIISGRNDSISNNTVADTVYNNVTATALGARAAGVKRVYIFPTSPDNLVNIPRASLEYLNGRLVTFAAAEDRIEFLDILSEWIDLAELTNARWNLPTDVFGGYTHDNTHGSLTFDRYLSTKFPPIFIALGIPERTINVSALLGQYNPTTNPFANVNGDNALFTGTNGQLNGVNNTGVAGATASGINRWNITTPAGVTVTPTIGTDEAGFNAQILTLSGTPSVDGSVNLTISPGFFGAGTNGGDTSRLFISEALVQLNSVTGLYGFSTTGNGLDPVTHSASTDVRSEAHRYPDNTTQRLFMRPNVPLTIASTSPSYFISFLVKNGVAISGEIKISRAPILRVA